MKLTDLNPHFTHEGETKVLVFECPKHCNMFGHCHSFRIPVTLGETTKIPPVWNIDSEDLNTLTMRPSVLDMTKNGKCGVHFYITKGEIQIL